MQEQLLKMLPRLRRFAFAMTGTAHDADDLLQGTVEKVLLKGVPENIPVEKWVFRVCRNLWIDEVRKQKVRAAVEFDETYLPVDSIDSESLMLDSITLAQVNRAMNELSEEQRTSLAMFALGDLTYAEIAEVLDVPIGTVMSRIARARKILIEKFQVGLPAKPEPAVKSSSKTVNQRTAAGLLYVVSR